MASQQDPNEPPLTPDEKARAQKGLVVIPFVAVGVCALILGLLAVGVFWSAECCNF